MPRKFACFCLSALLILSSGCSSKQKEEAGRKAAEAREKAAQGVERARAEGDKLGAEAKQKAQALNRDVNQAIQSGTAAGSASSAEQKLRNGSAKLQSAGDEAAVKLARAAIIAKVKAKLATDVGLNTVAGVEVDASGHVVTLEGTVSSPGTEAAGRTGGRAGRRRHPGRQQPSRKALSPRFTSER